MLITQFSCTQPKYVKSEWNENQQSLAKPTGEITSDCTIKFKNSETCLTWSWEVKPTDSQTGSLIFKIFRKNKLDASNIYLTPNGEVKLKLWMPEMGHGSSPTQIEMIDIGTFRARSVFFVMPGLWELKFQVWSDQVLSDEAMVNVEI